MSTVSDLSLAKFDPTGLCDTAMIDHFIGVWRRGKVVQLLSIRPLRTNHPIEFPVGIL